MMGWPLHQVDHMQIICTLQTDYHASNSSLTVLQASNLLKLLHDVYADKNIWTFHVLFCSAST